MADTAENKKKKSRRLFKWIAAIMSVFFVFVALDQLCSQNPFLWSCRCLAYLGLVLGLASFAYWLYVRHEDFAHRSRLKDESDVRASIVEAKTVEPRLHEPRRPEEFEEKKKELDEEIDRLEMIGKEKWTEYQVLSLYQMLVDFLKPPDLVSTTDSVMDDLEDYAADSKYRYDREYYAKWQQRVDAAKKEIDEAKDAGTDDAKDIERDDRCEELRAVLKTLHEHVANFHYNWAKGSALIRDLLIANAIAIPVFLTLGLVPVIHPSDRDTLGVINWAMLGVTGALAGALLGLHRSDEVEVGHTEGKREIWRTLSGAALGFVAGALTYGVIAGGLIKGIAVPVVGAIPLTVKDVGLSVIWGVAAGFSFERVFERVRTATEGTG